mmetsp:Transcript_24598/g.54806  ORF Transcript_24598/g.54806 Transcript_24598/m.54806 type:complete len:315 (-) Transcript_24598:49-993(-)
MRPWNVPPLVLPKHDEGSKLRARLAPRRGGTVVQDPASIEGEWCLGSHRVIIEDGHIYWTSGEVTEVRRSDTGAALIMVEDEEFTGNLSSDGHALSWSDGDVWFRPQDDAAELSEAGSASSSTATDSTNGLTSRSCKEAEVADWQAPCVPEVQSTRAELPGRQFDEFTSPAHSAAASSEYAGWGSEELRPVAVAVQADRSMAGRFPGKGAGVASSPVSEVLKAEVVTGPAPEKDGSPVYVGRAGTQPTSFLDQMEAMLSRWMSGCRIGACFENRCDTVVVAPVYFSSEDEVGVFQARPSAAASAFPQNSPVGRV